MKQRFLTTLALAAAIIMSSCITDVKIRGGKEDDKPAVLSFHPQMGGHGAATRADSFDATFTEFEDFFNLAGNDLKGGDHFDGFVETVEGNQVPREAGWGRALDRKINTFRVLVFYADGNQYAEDNDLEGHLVEHSDGVYANHLFDWEDDELPFEFELPVGLYDFLFVANDNGLFGAWGSNTNCETIDGIDETSPVKEINGLMEQKFVHSNTNVAGKINNNDPIPMATWFGGVTVTTSSISFTDFEGRYEDEEPGEVVELTGTWDVWMRRAAIRLSFGFHMGAAQFEAWKAAGGGTPALFIEGLNEKSSVYPWAYPGVDNNDAFKFSGTQSFNAYDLTSTATYKPGKILRHDGPGEDGSYEIFFDRLIYPEHLPAANNAANALRAILRFDYGSEMVVREIPIHHPNPTASGSPGYSLPRNSWVWTRARIFTDVDYETRVVPWGDGAIDPVGIMQYNLTTDRSEFLFGYEEHADRMYVTTDVSEGWKVADIEYDGVSSGWITVSPAEGVRNIETLTTVKVNKNTTGKVRTGYIIITAGNLTRTITVTQMPEFGGITDTDNGGKATMYVGAFWKAAQYGERLIRIDRSKVNPVNGLDGPWSAYVVEGGDWIRLDTENSDKASDGNASGFDETYKVPGYGTSVSGTMGTGKGEGDIYFRIGLNGPYTPTAEAPARYGMILLVYTNGTDTAYQRIWVRQGEGDDYLMQPDQELPGGGARDKATRFSPYNLTVEEFITSHSPTPSVNVRPGGAPSIATFTRYPTQAGAHFRWSDFTGTGSNQVPIVRAFNPVISQSYQASFSTSSWDPGHESCPAGYRRPVDGVSVSSVNNVLVAESEMHQSLLANARDGGRVGDTGNSAWGYYADGYFDRREIGTPSGTYLNGENGANSSVNTGVTTVAYVGRLFYNSERGNSLFFPAAGAHSSTTTSSPVIRRPGAVGAYWSSTGINGKQDALYFDMGVDNASRYYGNKGQIYSIRCVVDVIEPMISAEDPEEFDYLGGEKTVTVISLDGKGNPAEWDITGYDAADSDGNFDGTFAMGEIPAWVTLSKTWGEGGTETIRFTTVFNLNINHRSFKVRLTQADNPTVTTTFTVSQAPTYRVHASPGVVGIKRSAYEWLLRQRAIPTNGRNWIPRTDSDWSSYTAVHGHPLTIKGSNVYAGTWVDTNIAEGGKTDEFTANGYRGLETEPVFVVYFKWGSLIAMIGGGSSILTSGGHVVAGDTWSIDDVVWVNPEFTGNITASTSVNFGGFKPVQYDTSDYNQLPGNNDFGPFVATLGQGDICKELTGNRWRIPTGRPFAMTRAYSGVNSATGTIYPFGNFTTYGVRYWGQARTEYNAVTYWLDDTGPASEVTFGGGYSAADYVSVGLPVVQGQIASDNKDFFLPSAGGRAGGHVFGHGNGGGYYWTSSAEDDDTCYILYFGDISVDPSSTSHYDYALPVRCVKDPD